MQPAVPPEIYSAGSQMIRPLTEADAPAFAAFCARYPLRLLTPRLNIEAYGFQSTTVRSWGAFEQAQMTGLLLRFFNTAVAVDGDGSCAPGFAQVIDRENGLAGLRGT